MRIVIDRCSMDSDDLREFLSQAPTNIAVLTDYSAIEAFKGDALTNTVTSWRVLKDFPTQIIALKGNREAGLIKPQAPGIAERMIDKKATKSLVNFQRVLASAEAGNQITQAQLLQRGKQADEHLASILAKSGEISSSIEAFQSKFTPTELKRMRRMEEWKEDTILKFFEVVLEQATREFERHPGKPVMPGPKHVFNHFIVRYTLAYLVYVMELVRRGTTNRRADLVRNDAVDVINATYATYFNGFMTQDDGAMNTFRLTRYLLEQLDARVPDDYIMAGLKKSIIETYFED